MVKHPEIAEVERKWHNARASGEGEGWSARVDPDGGIHGYIFVGPNGGRFSETLPAGVEEKDVKKVTLSDSDDKSGVTLISLLNDLLRLVDAEGEQSSPIHKVARQVLDFNASQALHMECGLVRALIRRPPELVLSHSAVLQLEGVMMRFQHGLTTAPIAGRAMLLYNLLPERGTTAWHTLHGVVLRQDQRFGPPKTAEHEFQELLRSILLVVNADEPLEEIGMRMLKMSENSQNDAKSVGNPYSFYDTIFMSLPPAESAHLAFSLLAQYADSDDTKKRNKRLATVAEERLVVAKSTLLGTLINAYSADVALKALRERIARTRQEEGEVAAEDLVREHLHLQLSYPWSFRDYLCGQSDDIPYWLEKSVPDGSSGDHPSEAHAPR